LINGEQMTADVHPEKLIPVTKLADQLGVHRTTLYRAIRAGLLDALRVGVGKGALRITPEARDAYLAACRENAITH
jgi:excisionase family DNA binding protein